MRLLGCWESGRKTIEPYKSEKIAGDDETKSIDVSEVDDEGTDLQG